MSTAPQPGTYASSSHSRFTCTKEISVETCLRLNDTLQGRYVGPGDVKGFVKREMPGADGKKFPLLDFSKVLEGATVEVDMYEPIVSEMYFSRRSVPLRLFRSELSSKAAFCRTTRKSS